MSINDVKCADEFSLGVQPSLAELNLTLDPDLGGQGTMAQAKMGVLRGILTDTPPNLRSRSGRTIKRKLPERDQLYLAPTAADDPDDRTWRPRRSQGSRGGSKRKQRSADQGEPSTDATPPSRGVDRSAGESFMDEITRSVVEAASSAWSPGPVAVSPEVAWMEYLALPAKPNTEHLQLHVKTEQNQPDSGIAQPTKSVELKCPCDITFSTLGELTTHVYVTHRNLSYCELCGKFLARKQARTKHLRDVHQYYHCHHCDTEFGSDHEFREHYRLVHRSTVHACQHCGFRAESKVKLSRHRVLAHGAGSTRNDVYKNLSTGVEISTCIEIEKAPFACMSCDLVFMDEAAYKAHELQHSFQKIYTETREMHNLDENCSEVKIECYLKENENKDIDIVIPSISTESEVITNTTDGIEEQRNTKSSSSKITCTFVRIESESNVNHFVEFSDDFVGSEVNIEHLTEAMKLDDGTLLQMSSVTFENMKDCREIQSQRLDPNTLLVTSLHHQTQAQNLPETANSQVTIVAICDACGKLKIQNVCPFCDTSRREKLEVVTRTENSIADKLKCPKCDASFVRGLALRNHLTTHLPSPLWPYTCSFCFKKYVSNDSYQKHLKNNHKTFKCPNSRCSRTFETVDLCKAHIVAHNLNPRVKCYRCLTWTDDEMEFQKHLNICRGPVFKCRYCAQAFLENDNLLAAHMKSHDHYMDRSKELTEIGQTSRGLISGDASESVQLSSDDLASLKELGIEICF